jgi:signal recognition particle subunit SRP54
MFNFLAQRFSSIFSGFGQATAFTEQNISKVITQIQEALIQSDVPYEVVDIFLTQLKTDLIGQKITKGIRPDEQLLKIVYQRMVNFFGARISRFCFSDPLCNYGYGTSGLGQDHNHCQIGISCKNASSKKA